MKMMSKWAFMAVVSLSAIVSLCLTSNVTRDTDTSSSILVSDPSTANFTQSLDQNSTSQPPSPPLLYDFYQNTCPNAEPVILNFMKKMVVQNSNSTAQLLRLLFHDCFIQGCDASVLIAGSNGTERDAIPNRTLKGFEFIGMMKEEIEKECPGIVSCADILVLSVRDSILMSGGPFYPISTGRRDGTSSFRVKADDEIPRPMSNVSDFLRLFSLRGFDESETTVLLGGHNIGHIGCEFVTPRFEEFKTSSDPSMDPGFFEELRQKCMINNATSISNSMASSQTPRHLSESSHSSAESMSYSQELVEDLQPFSRFDGHYYRTLVAGKGILFSDQQLMGFEKTLKVVQEYAADDAKFRVDFARAMMKLSNLGVLTGSQGEIRRNCTVPLNGQA